MRADRLMSIVLLLQSYTRLTSAELAERLGVSERTVHRDMTALSTAGIPVYAERGTNGGWLLSEGYRTRLTGLRKEELHSLLLTRPSKALEDLGLANEYESAFLKLLAALPDSVRTDAEYARQRILIDGTGWQAASDSNRYLPVVQEAVWSNRKLSITYERGGDKSERMIEPLGIVSKGNAWYVVASIQDTIRSYRLSRIHDAVLLDATFERPEKFDLLAYWQESTASFSSRLPRFVVTLLAHEQAAAKIASLRFAAVLENEHSQNGERVQCKVDFQSEEYACETLIGLGAEVEVIAPESLRIRLLRTAEAVVRLYRAQSGAGNH